MQSLLPPLPARLVPLCQGNRHTLLCVCEWFPFLFRHDKCLELRCRGQLGDICFLEFAEEMSLYGELVGVLNSTSGNLIDFGFKKRFILPVVVVASIAFPLCNSSSYSCDPLFCLLLSLAQLTHIFPHTPTYLCAYIHTDSYRQACIHKCSFSTIMCTSCIHECTTHFLS